MTTNAPEMMERICRYYLEKYNIVREMGDKQFLLDLLRTVYDQGFSDGSNAVLCDGEEETFSPDWI